MYSLARKPEKAFFFGNSRLLVRTEGTSVKYIGDFFGNPLCTLISNEETKESSYSANECVVTIEDPSEIAPVKEVIHFFDYISCDKPVFIRNISAMRRSSFKIIPAPGLYISYIDNFYIGSCAVKCLVISSPSDQKRLYIGLIGDFRYTPETNRIWFEFGYSDIIFSYGLPDEAVSNLKSTYKSIEYENPLELQPQNKIYLKTHSYASAHSEKLIYPDENSRSLHNFYDGVCALYEKFSDLAYCLRMESGAYITEPQISGLQRLDSMLSVVPALVITGYSDLASGIIKFAISVYRRYGCLPLFTDVKGDETGAQELGFASSLKALRAILFFCERTGDHSLLSENTDFTDGMIKLLCTKAICGALPFTGYESCFDNEDVSTTIRFQGSAENTLEYITLAEKYLSFTDENKIGIRNRNGIINELNIARANYKKSFFTDEGIAINFPGREEQIKHPHFTYGKCDICCIKERESWSVKGRMNSGWIERNKAGFYTCPDCFSEVVGSRFLAFKSGIRYYNTEILLDNCNHWFNHTDRFKLINTIKYRIADVKTLSLTEITKSLGIVLTAMPDKFDEFLDAMLEKSESENIRMDKLAACIEIIDKLSKA